MLHNLKLGGWMLFHIVVIFFAIVLITTAIYPPVHAQNNGEVRELARRLSVIEGMDISGQLAGIHQQLADMVKQGEQRDSDWKPIGTAVAAGLLVLKEAALAISGKIKREDS